MSLFKKVKTWLRGIGGVGFQYGSRETLYSTVDRQLFEVRKLRLERRDKHEVVIRGLAASHYLGGNDAICWCLGRYRMFVDTRDVGFSTFMMMDGCWEMPVTEALVERLKPGMHVVDCGANLGYYSLIAADLVGADGSLHCIEPNPHLVRRLKNTISVNGFQSRISIHEVALGAENGSVVLEVPAGEPKNGRLNSIPLDEMAANPNIHKVHLCCLDYIIGDDPVDLIKIDVEGSEEAVWKGMSGILARNQPLIILLEFTANRYVEPRRFIDEILAAGFRIEIITAHRGVEAVTREQLLIAPGDVDQMLLLTR